MSSNTTAASSSGIGFFGLLTLLFIGLKLTGHITWSWLWVLAPMWIPATIIVGLIVTGFTFIAIDKQLSSD